MVRALLVAALVVAAIASPGEARSRRRDLCSGGKVFFRVTITPIDGASTPQKTVLEVRTRGAWTRSEDGAVMARGCVASTTLRLLRKAVDRARFKTTRDATCRAPSTQREVLEAPRRKREVTTAAPCGTPIDERTATARACFDAAIAGGATADADAICKGG